MQPSKTARPNIVLIMTDQQKASATSVHGNSVVSSPAWDRAAESGVVFDNCISTSPVCTPARVGVMTGLYPLASGCSSVRHRPDHFPQLNEILGEHGYHTGGVGRYEENYKWQWGRAWHHLELGMPDVLRVAQELAEATKPLRGWVSGAHPLPADRGLARMMTDHAIDFVDNVGREPFFLHVAYLEPHPPYFPPEPFASMHDLDDIELPPTAFRNRPRWQIEAGEEMLVPLAEERDIRAAIARYYGLISYADSEIGRFMDHLAAKGLLENTWVILTSDHGDFTGEHGLFAKAHAMYDCLLHVPLVIMPPKGSGGSGRHVPNLNQSHDLFPTILDIAGIDTPDNCQARSLIGLMDGSGGGAPVHEYCFASAGMIGNPMACFPQGIPERGFHRDMINMVRTDRCKYIEDATNGDEFYDLARDPHELGNTIDTAPQPVLAELRDALSQHRKECRDMRRAAGYAPDIPLAFNPTASA